MREITLTYPRELFKLWGAGLVHRVWFLEHDGLFDQSDLAVIRNQYRRGHHFGEWFAAIHFWSRGYRVLIEKYAFRKHKKHFATAVEVIGKDGMDFFARNARTRAQPPDLLVFDPYAKFYFFAEVKREQDRLREKQGRFFEEIERELRCQIIVVTLKAR